MLLLSKTGSFEQLTYLTCSQDSFDLLTIDHIKICWFYSDIGAGTPAAWSEQSQVVVETVTKTSTTQKFAAAQQVVKSDATKVVAQGAGLQKAFINKEAQFTVNTANAGKYIWNTDTCQFKVINNGRSLFTCVILLGGYWVFNQRFWLL